MKRFYPHIGYFINRLISEGYEFIAETDKDGKIIAIHSEAFHRGRFRRKKEELKNKK